MQDSKLLDSVEIILFHGASFSVVLDRFGEPTKLKGALEYPILVSEPGHILRRNVPSPGLYLSVQKYGFSTFKVNGSSISRVLFGGVGGFDENFGGGVVDRHEFHKRIQAYLDGYASQSYVAGIALESASNAVDITVRLVADKLPDIAVLSIPYAIAAIRKLISGEMLQETLKTIAEEVVKQILIDVVRDKVIEFVIKKLGGKLIPFINAALAIADFVGREDERRRIRNALGALMLALGGRTSDEDEIAGKVLGDIMAEEFQKEVIQALTKMARHAVPKGDKSPEPEPSEPPHAKRTEGTEQPHPSPHRPDAPSGHRVPLPADAKLPQGIVAGNKDAPKLGPPTPPPETPETRRGIDDRGVSGVREEEPAAVQPAVQAAEVPKAVPSHEVEAAPASSTENNGTESKTIGASGTEDGAIQHIGLEAIRGEPHEESTTGRGTEETGAIMRIGNDSVGVHERSADALTTRRGLRGDMPETGTAMGFQTQIGREVVTAIGAPGHEVQVTSRNPNVLIGAEQGRFRDDTLTIIANDPDHPMRPIYDPNTRNFVRPPYQHGNLKQWQLHPYDWQAGHMRSPGPCVPQGMPMSSCSKAATAIRNRARVSNATAT